MPSAAFKPAIPQSSGSGVRLKPPRHRDQQSVHLMYGN